MEIVRNRKLARFARLLLVLAVSLAVSGFGTAVSAKDDDSAEKSGQGPEDGDDESGENSESDDDEEEESSESDDGEEEDAAVGQPMVFPVAGDHSFIDSWHFPRDGGARLHKGTDIVAERHSLLVATVDGVIETVRHSNSGKAGNMVVLRDDDGNRFYYIHLNNDEPGTDNGANLAEQAFAPGIAEGVRVAAGDPVGYVGDSGNAENSVPHVHFALKVADGTTVNPYPSLIGADLNGQTPAVFGQLAVTGPRDMGFVGLGAVLLIVGALFLFASARFESRSSASTVSAG